MLGLVSVEDKISMNREIRDDHQPIDVLRSLAAVHAARLDGPYFHGLLSLQAIAGLELPPEPYRSDLQRAFTSS